MKIIIVKKGNFEYALTLDAFKVWVEQFNLVTYEDGFSLKDALKRFKELDAKNAHDEIYGDSFEIQGRLESHHELYLKGRRVTLKRLVKLTNVNTGESSTKLL